MAGVRRDLPWPELRRARPHGARVHGSRLRVQRLLQGLRDDRLAPRLSHRAQVVRPHAPAAPPELLHLLERVRAVGGRGGAPGGRGGRAPVPGDLRRAPARHGGRGFARSGSGSGPSRPGPSTSLPTRGASASGPTTSRSRSWPEPASPSRRASTSGRAARATCASRTPTACRASTRRSCAWASSCGTVMSAPEARGTVAATPWDVRLARVLVRPLRHTPLTPNGLTTLGLLASLAAAWLMASGDPRRAALGGGLFMLAVLVDHMDGEFARLTGLTSRFGHYYDHVAAGLGYVSLFAGLGIGLRSGSLGAWAAGRRRGRRWVDRGRLPDPRLPGGDGRTRHGRAGELARIRARGRSLPRRPRRLAGPPRRRSCWRRPSARRCSSSGWCGARSTNGRPPRPGRKAPPKVPFDAGRTAL